MPSDPSEKRITFAGVPSASTTSAWNLNPARALAYSYPLPLRPANRSNVASASSSIIMPLPRVKELDIEILDHTSYDLSALLSGSDVLRIRVALDKMPFALLDALHTHLEDNGHLAELHICISTSLRPALEIVSKNLGLERGLKNTIRKWNSTDTTLRFYFLLADHPEQHTFDEHCEVDFSLALDRLARGPAAFEAMSSLAQDNVEAAQASPSTYRCDSNEPADEDVMELDDWL